MDIVHLVIKALGLGPEPRPEPPELVPGLRKFVKWVAFQPADRTEIRCFLIGTNGPRGPKEVGSIDIRENGYMFYEYDDSEETGIKRHPILPTLEKVQDFVSDLYPEGKAND